jgi:hypothetical protein
MLNFYDLVASCRRRLRRRRRTKKNTAAGAISADASPGREPSVRSPEDPDRALDDDEFLAFLQSRPSVEQLVQQNILKASVASPAIAAISDSVSKLQHRDFLARSLRRFVV